MFLARFLCCIVVFLGFIPQPSPTHAYHGEDHDIDDVSAASQLERDEYDRKKKMESIAGLKAELGEHPDLTGRTQRDGTKREHTIRSAISKDRYWSNTVPIGYDFDVIPGLRYMRASDFYEPVPAENYHVNLIVDPCRGHEPGCCQDVFGTPQYVGSTAARVPGTISALLSSDGDGDTSPVANSRLQDQYLHFDPDCDETIIAGSFRETKGTLSVKSSFDGFGNDVFTRCVGHNLAMDLDLKAPACWDHNNTVNATLPCFTVNGDRFPSCLAIGYFSSAYVVQCGGAYREDDHCGTFVELHQAKTGEVAAAAASATLTGLATGKSACGVRCNERVLAQVRLEGGFSGGYRTTTLPLTIRGNASEVVCEGNYELWWVQRTLWGFVTQFKKNFTVVAPECDFDVPYDREEQFSTAALPEFTEATGFVPGH